ncbi:MAG: hypothetical protein JWO80_3477 [Bryobacterales bacterium]|nr:hypothetical protein [Bryobacterales bacterium]
MLAALQRGRATDFRVTLAALGSFFPVGATACEVERRDLLERVGEEVIAHGAAKEDFALSARKACRMLLEHLAGAEFHAASRYVQ